MEQVTQGTKERLMSDVNTVLVEAEDLLRQAAQSTGEQATDHWVHDHPWTAMGFAAGLGVLIGLAINRR